MKLRVMNNLFNFYQFVEYCILLTDSSNFFLETLVNYMLFCLVVCFFLPESWWENSDIHFKNKILIQYS